MKSIHRAPTKGAFSYSDEARGDASVQPWVWVRGISHAYADLEVLAHISLSLKRHERLAVVGPSGCGKSTLLEIVGGLRNPRAGSVAIGGASGEADRLARCALMPQKDLLLPWRCALDNACIALENQGMSRKAARQRALPHLERFDLGQFADARAWELSGGMRQRVAFLRTLLAGKEVLLLDEPFGSLDSITRAQMQEWLVAALDREPRTVLLVTHDVEEALVICDRVAVLSGRPGRIVEQLTTSFDRDLPRHELVTTPAFVALREQALETLEKR